MFFRLGPIYHTGLFVLCPKDGNDTLSNRCGIFEFYSKPPGRPGLCGKAAQCGLLLRPPLHVAASSSHSKQGKNPTSIPPKSPLSCEQEAENQLGGKGRSAVAGNTALAAKPAGDGSYDFFLANGRAIGHQLALNRHIRKKAATFHLSIQELTR